MEYSALNCEAKIRLCLRKNATRTTTTIHSGWALLNNKDIRNKYTLALKQMLSKNRQKHTLRMKNIRISSTPT